MDQNRTKNGPNIEPHIPQTDNQQFWMSAPPSLHFRSGFEFSRSFSEHMDSFNISEDHNFTFYYDEGEEDFGTTDSYIFYVDGILLLVVALLGIVGTLMSIVVLLKPRIRDFFSGFLTALSVCDALFLILAIPVVSLPALSVW